MTLPKGWPDGVRLIRFDTLDSTNEKARRLAAAGDTGPVWITARVQSKGRGRRGNSWISDPGNLFATLLLQTPHATAAQLGFAASLATADVVASYAEEESATHRQSPQLLASPLEGEAVAKRLKGGIHPTSAEHGLTRVRLKWPNDVLLDNRKVAGILLETAGPDALAIGIGINLAHHPEGTETPAISVNSAIGRSIDPDDALGNLAARFAAWYGTWRSEGFAGLKPHWLKRASGLGGPIRARLADREIKGVFEGLDHDGALLLRGDAGLTRITAAEIFFPPPLLSAEALSKADAGRSTCTILTPTSPSWGGRTAAALQRGGGSGGGSSSSSEGSS